MVLVCNTSEERTPLRRKTLKKAKRVRPTRQEKQQIFREILLSDVRELKKFIAPLM
ncbi:hypothetical protein DPMN_060307 [Dreissena polymorpha]|uniref:Uncharacterized protein n=1 Tax=Dreissena polymorpha TaxID=45954 RepID=A0A9D4C5H3_DREPO|nr:hypothetical protein DPMN_060307 [Dreissena polymorpha]